MVIADIGRSTATAAEDGSTATDRLERAVTQGTTGTASLSERAERLREHLDGFDTTDPSVAGQTR